MARLSWGGASSQEELGSLAGSCSFCLSRPLLAFPAVQVLASGSFGAPLQCPSLLLAEDRVPRGVTAQGDEEPARPVAVLLPPGDKTQSEAGEPRVCNLF